LNPVEQKKEKKIWRSVNFELSYNHPSWIKRHI